MAAFAGVVGCSGGDDHPAPAGDDQGDGTVVVTSTASADVVRTGPCADEGKSEVCQIETGRAGNVVNCFRGRQTCAGGRWGACGEGDQGKPAGSNGH